MTDIAGLIERLEAATGPDRELDAAIVAHLNNASVRRYPPQTDFGPGARWQFWSLDGAHFLGNESKFPVPALTASLDAALALVERVRPGWKVSLFIGHLTGKKNGEGCRAELYAPGRPKRIAAQDWKWPKMAACYYAPTPAIALLIALLRTLETEQ